MNPIDVFLATTNLRTAEAEIKDGELYIVEYDSFRKFISKSHISRHRHYDRAYQGIKNCCDNRIKDPKNKFVCICGACQTYLLSKVYDMLYNTKPVSVTPTPEIKSSRSETTILEETLDELFEEDKPTASASTTATIAPPIIPANPLDGAVMAFGKYKDRTFKDVFDSDKGYCMWCIENSAIKQVSEPHKRPLENMVQFVTYAKQKFTV